VRKIVATMLFFAGAAVAAAYIGIPLGALSLHAHAGGHPITICHRTDSETHPYVRETVDAASTRFAGHDGHTGGVWFNGHAKEPKWGDIIPPTDDDHDLAVTPAQLDRRRTGVMEQRLRADVRPAARGTDDHLQGDQCRPAADELDHRDLHWHDQRRAVLAQRELRRADTASRRRRHQQPHHCTGSTTHRRARDMDTRPRQLRRRRRNDHLPQLRTHLNGPAVEVGKRPEAILERAPEARARTISASRSGSQASALVSHGL